MLLQLAVAEWQRGGGGGRVKMRVTLALARACNIIASAAAVATSSATTTQHHNKDEGRGKGRGCLSGLSAPLCQRQKTAPVNGQFAAAVAAHAPMQSAATAHVFICY